ncbi:DNA-binding protein [Schizothecium vesticola]|uniref:DNA-binding protein n=1 Tax=Schizothecium vesticola TaxID=314040 RepID=A0AA40EVT0_9PEZI|nr:DNA-binding protein [Schizothecium vesticola]
MPPCPTPLGRDQSHPLLSSFPAFLLVAIHNLLYYRGLYPRTTFLSTRAYNLPVHQSRHPAVCAWIRSAVDAITSQLARGAVARVAVVMHAPSSSSRAVLERWVFDTTSFPAWPASGIREPARVMAGFGRMQAKEARGEEGEERHGIDFFPAEAAEGVEQPPGTCAGRVSWPDVDEQLRGALRRMAHAAEGMRGLPEGCSFTVAVEMREEGEGPIGHPQAWIPSEPNLQPVSSTREMAGEDVGGVRTTPIRSVQAGPLFFECWLEEARAKFTGEDGNGNEEMEISGNSGFGLTLDPE